MLPVLLSIGPIQLYSLSLFVVLGWCVFSLIFWKALRKEAIGEECIFDLMFWGTVSAFIAARIGFILIHPEQFSGSLLKMLALWVAPGLALYPGLIVGIFTIVWLGKRWGVRAAMLADSLAFSLPGSLAVGSIGALLGGSVVGVKAALPWATNVVGYEGLRHPAGAYFALVLVALLGFLTVLDAWAKEKDWPLGLLGVAFFLFFSLSFFFLEFLVEHRLYWGGLSANQWILLFIFCQAVGAFYVRYGRIRLRGS